MKKNKIMKFGDITIDDKIIFYKRKLVFAFTNLKPFYQAMFYLLLQEWKKVIQI